MKHRVVTLVLSLTVFEMRPLIALNFSLKIAAKPLQMKTWLVAIDNLGLQEVPSALSDGTIADPLRDNV